MASCKEKMAMLECEIELSRMQMISEKEAHIIREWFDHAEETAGIGYLDKADYDTAAKIYKICGRKLPGSIKRGNL